MSEKILFPRLFKGIAMFTPGGSLVYAIDPNKQDYWHLNLCAALQEIFRLPEPPHFLVPAYTATIDLWLDPRTKQLRTSTEIYRPVRHNQALLNAVFGTANLTWQVAPWEESLCDPILIETYRQQFPQLWEDRDLIVRWERVEGSTSYAYSHSLGVGLPKIEQNSTLALETPLGARETVQGRGTTGVNNNTYSEKPLLWYGKNLKLNMNQEDFANPERSVLSSASLSPQLLDLAYTQNMSISPGTDKSFSPELLSTKLSTSLEESKETESQSQQQPTQGYVLRLFVSQNSEATEQTLKSLHELLENSIRHPYTLKVIDVFKHPDQAEANQVSATPTLVRIWPLPVRRLVGDLSDIDRVLRILVTPSED
jgi:circadian clock protein KaiB